MEKKTPENEGLRQRQRKRRETRERITETGLKLILANGYEATTLDAIAEAAGISRRTFFYYFKSKEEILLAWQSGVGEAIRAAVVEESPDQAPLDAVRNALLKLASRYNSDQMIAIDQLLRSTDQLRASKQAKYVQQEQALFDGLCELWPQPKRRNGLRLVAMVAIGAMRLALDRWGEEGGKRTVATCLKEAFADLKAEI
jgi:AcrR family transcriptional regulator